MTYARGTKVIAM